MTEPKQPNRRNRRVTQEATPEVASSIQPPVASQQVKQEGLPHSNGSEKRVERLPSGLVILHP